MTSEDVVDPITERWGWFFFFKTHFSIRGGALLQKTQVFF